MQVSINTNFLFSYCLKAIYSPYLGNKIHQIFKNALHVVRYTGKCLPHYNFASGRIQMSQINSLLKTTVFWRIHYRAKLQVVDSKNNIIIIH